MTPHGHASHSEAATADCCLPHLQLRRLPLLKSKHRIAPTLQNTPRAGAVVRCWQRKMAGQFSSTTQTVGLRTYDGRSLAGQKIFGDLQRWRLCKRAFLDSTIRCRTRSPSGRVIRANRRSRFGNCSAKPTGLKARRVFSDLRFAIETRWRSLCPAWLNLDRLLSTAQVTFRFFPNCCARNWEGAALSATSKRTWPTGLDCTISNTKKTRAAIRCLRPALN